MKRAWILFDDGTSKEIGPECVDDESITWPPPVQPTDSGQQAPYFSVNDMYRRHEVIKDTAYVFMRDSEGNSEVPAEFVDRIRPLIEKTEG